MSFEPLCDICGKTPRINNAQFTEEPLCIEKTNFKGEKYKIFLYMVPQNSKDYDNLNNYYMGLTDKVSIDNTFSHICNACKKELIFDIMKNGYTDPNATSIGKIKQEMIEKFTAMVEEKQKSKSKRNKRGLKDEQTGEEIPQ